MPRDYESHMPASRELFARAALGLILVFIRRKPTALLLVCGWVTFLSQGGCTGAGTHHSTYDPIENVNRPIHGFNDSVDQTLMQPLVDAYLKHVSWEIRLSVSNFFDNAFYGEVIVNNFLQGKWKHGFSDVGRFVTNSTLGIGGLFDVASLMGLEKHQEDFGQTLGVWGVRDGPYLTLPFLGPSNGRDLPRYFATFLTSPFFWVSVPAMVTWPLAALAFFDLRVKANDAIQTRNEVALDSYLFTREAYLENRTFLIYDGNPPIEDLFIEDELLLDEGEARPSECGSDPKECGKNVSP